MRLLADVHMSPRTVRFLNELGHDAIRSDSILPATAPDEEIVDKASELGRTILTQDLDFSNIIALSGRSGPSVVSLRLSDSRVENVNRALLFRLPPLEDEIESGVIATIEDRRVRIRKLPVQR